MWDGWEAAWSGRDPSAFGPLMSADGHYEDPVCPVPLLGPSAVGAHARRLWDAFPDVRMESTGERLSDSAGRFQAAPARLVGTNRGDLGELPPTNRFVTVQVLTYAEFRDDVLLRVRAFVDLVDAGRQLDVLPSPGGMAERALLLLKGFGLRL